MVVCDCVEGLSLRAAVGVSWAVQVVVLDVPSGRYALP